MGRKERLAGALHPDAEGDVLLARGALDLSRSALFPPVPSKRTLSVLIKEMLHASLSLLVFLAPETATFSWATRALGLVIFPTGRCTDSCSAIPRSPCLIPGHAPAGCLEMDFCLFSHHTSVMS